MYDPKEIGLCSSTIMLTADFRGICEAASKAGFSGITMLPNIFSGALESGLSEQDMRAILDDNGLRITEMDPFCAWLPTRLPETEMESFFYSFDEDYFYRMHDALGANSLNLIQPSPDFVEKDKVVEALVGVSQRAAARGLDVSIEYLRWCPINSLDAAMELVVAADQPNLGVNIDTWHHFRTGGTVEQIRNINPAYVKAMQFNDVEETAWENVKEETSLGRKMPGEGFSNSVEVARAFWEAGVRVPLNVEVFNAEIFEMDPNIAAQKMADSMRKVLSEAAS